MTHVISLPAMGWLTKPALISKSAMLAAAICGVWSFAITELLTERTIFAAVCSLISAPACAYFAARPKTLAEIRMREEGQRTFAENQMRELVTHMTEIHRQEVAMLNRQLRQRERVENLVRYSKHQALKALDGAEAMAQAYSELLKAHEIAHPKMTKADKGELFAEENKALLKAGTKDDEEGL